MPESPSPQTVELPALSFRAEIGSVNEEARTVDVIFTTGAPVARFDWMSGKRYLETLSTDPAHVRLDRLNSGAPLLDTHSGYSLSDQIGVVQDGSAKMAGKRGLATVRFSKRDAVEPIWQDVKDRIVTKISVGYLVHKYEESASKDGSVTTRKAIDWEPFELSFVPMPADPGAQTRDGKSQVRTHPCIITRGAEPADVPTEEIPMAEERTASETIVERDPLDPGAPTHEARARETAEVVEPSDRDLGGNVERARIRGIMDGCESARLPKEIMKRLIDEGVPLVEAQRQILSELGKRGGDDLAPRRPQVSLGEDPLVHVRSGIENALLYRLAPSHFQISDVGRRYRGMNMLDVARAFLQARGIRVTDMSKNQLAAEALGLSQRGGMHTTSDFPNLLADVANKVLRRAYEEQPQTFAPLVTRRTLPDYKTVKVLQMGDAPALLEVKEHGEYKSGTIGEGKEQYQLVKYGRKFAITREALINDDTDSFSRVPMMFGRRARILESDKVWAQITSNPTMGDGNALFSAAHGNLETDGDAIAIASLGRARASLRVQTSLDGALLNLSSRYLVVPTTLETIADQYVTVVTPQTAGQVNPFQGRMQVIAEPRLDAVSTTAWYLFASSDQIDMIEIAYLEGEEGPQVESRVGFDIDGVEIKCRLDFGTKVIDWRGIHKDPGENVS